MMTVREINAACRAGRYVYLISARWTGPEARQVRIIAAKTKHRVLFVKALSSGKWLMIFSTDRINVSEY